MCLISIRAWDRNLEAAPFSIRLLPSPQRCGQVLLVRLVLQQMPHLRAVEREALPPRHLRSADLEELGQVEQDGESKDASDVQPEEIKVVML